MTSLLSPARFVLDDARLRGRMRNHVDDGATAEAAVERVMREYTRVLSSSGERLLVGSRARGGGAVLARAQSPGRAGVEAAAGVGAGGGAADRVRRDRAARRPRRGAVLVGAGGGVAGPRRGRARWGCRWSPASPELFRWVSDGDRVLVNGEAGSVIVNPSRVDVAAHRKR